MVGGGYVCAGVVAGVNDGKLLLGVEFLEMRNCSVVENCDCLKVGSWTGLYNQCYEQQFSWRTGDILAIRNGG